LRTDKQRKKKKRKVPGHNNTASAHKRIGTQPHAQRTRLFSDDKHCSPHFFRSFYFFIGLQSTNKYSYHSRRKRKRERGEKKTRCQRRRIRGTRRARVRRMMPRSRLSWKSKQRKTGARFRGPRELLFVLLRLIRFCLRRASGRNRVNRRAAALTTQRATHISTQRPQTPDSSRSSSFQLHFQTSPLFCI
jgi:hypothetical protein